MQTVEKEKTFTIHTLETAPEASRGLLDDSKKAYGYVPNLHAVLAESPGLLEAYKNIHTLFENSSFNKEELTVVWQTINVEHKCHYCVPAHTAIAKAMQVDEGIIEALRNKTTLENSKLETLRKTTLEIVRNRGELSQEVLNNFFEAGYTQRHLLDIILGVSQKVISNYVNHIAETPLDKGFQKYDWKAE